MNQKKNPRTNRKVRNASTIANGNNTTSEGVTTSPIGVTNDMALEGISLGNTTCKKKLRMDMVNPTKENVCLLTWSAKSHSL